uniref:ARAD1B22176p n=1 Tax=Blastobotrys adeninivorans TaxID=409370 RepID=A0A060T7B0_BLAAD
MARKHWWNKLRSSKRLENIVAEDEGYSKKLVASSSSSDKSTATPPIKSAANSPAASAKLSAEYVDSTATVDGISNPDCENGHAPTFSLSSSTPQDSAYSIRSIPNKEAQSRVQMHLLPVPDLSACGCTDCQTKANFSLPRTDLTKPAQYSTSSLFVVRFMVCLVLLITYPMAGTLLFIMLFGLEVVIQSQKNSAQSVSTSKDGRYPYFAPTQSNFPHDQVFTLN